MCSRNSFLTYTYLLHKFFYTGDTAGQKVPHGTITRSPPAPPPRSGHVTDNAPTRRHVQRQLSFIYSNTSGKQTTCLHSRKQTAATCLLSAWVFVVTVMYTQAVPVNQFASLGTGFLIARMIGAYIFYSTNIRTS